MQLPVHSAFYGRKLLALLTASQLYCTVVEMMGEGTSHIKGVTPLGLTTFEIGIVIKIIGGVRELSKLEGVRNVSQLNGVFSALRRLGYKFSLSNSSSFSNETIWDFSIDHDKLNLLDKYRDYITGYYPEFVFLYDGHEYKSCITVETKESTNVR